MGGQFELVISNPPYVLPDEILAPELAYEPRVALIDEGQTQAIAAAARDVVHGWLVLEMHEEREVEVARMLSELGYGGIRIAEDLARKNRVVEALCTTTGATKR